MTRLREGRVLSAAVLAVLALAVSLFPSLPSPAAWGEPDGMLSGLFGDIYTLDSGRQIVVYYDTQPLNDGTGDGHTVPVRHIAISEP